MELINGDARSNCMTLLKLAIACMQRMHHAHACRVITTQSVLVGLVEMSIFGVSGVGLASLVLGVARRVLVVCAKRSIFGVSGVGLASLVLDGFWW